MEATPLQQLPSNPDEKEKGPKKEVSAAQTLSETDVGVSGWLTGWEGLTWQVGLGAARFVAGTEGAR